MGGLGVLGGFGVLGGLGVSGTVLWGVLGGGYGVRGLWGFLKWFKLIIEREMMKINII